MINKKRPMIMLSVLWISGVLLFSCVKKYPPMQSNILQVGSQKIAYYESRGTGPAALLIHGNSSSALSFQHQINSTLGDKFHLVAIDLPGHGESEPATEPVSTYTLPGYASIVVGVAEQLGLNDAVFVGWSLGGHIVLEATSQLQNASGFMIFGTPPIGFPPAMSEAFLPNPAMPYAFMPDLTEVQIDSFVTACFKPDVTTIPESFKADFRRTDGQARLVLGGSIGPDGYKDEIEIVTNLSVPLAILHGKQEQLVNEAYISTLTIPTLWRGAVQIIPDAGHATHWEQPGQFNELLGEFIEESTKIGVGTD